MFETPEEAFMDNRLLKRMNQKRVLSFSLSNLSVMSGWRDTSSKIEPVMSRGKVQVDNGFHKYFSNSYHLKREKHP